MPSVPHRLPYCLPRQSRRSTATIALAWLAILVWLVGGPSRSLALGTGSIEGSIRYEGKAVPEQRIMLIRFGPDQDVQRIPGQTDAQGRFLFEHLELGSHYTYFIGVRYNEHLHRSTPIILLNEQRADITVDLNDTAQQAAAAPGQQPGLYIANHLLVVVKREAHLEVREIVRLVNAGTTPYIEPAGSPGVGPLAFQLPLLQGAYNLSQIQGLASEHIRTQASSIAYVAPLAPGEHRIMFSYHLPWREVLTTLLLVRTLPTAMLDLLVEDEGLVATSDLQFSGQVSMEPHTFAHFRGVELGTQTRSWVQLVSPSMTSTTGLAAGIYGAIVTLGLLGICTPLYRLGGSRATPPGQGVGQREAIHRARAMAQRIVHEFTLLESQRASGQVTTAEYQQRRQDCKERLRHLVANFHLS